MALKDSVKEAMEGDELEVDFSGAKDRFGKVPEKEYEAEVVEAKAAKVKSGKNEGQPKAVLKFKITEEGPAKGRVFFKHLVAKGDDSGILRDVVRALGVQTDGLSGLKLGPLVGKTCLVKIGEQKNNPEMQEIKYVKAAAAKTTRLA